KRRRWRALTLGVGVGAAALSLAVPMAWPDSCEERLGSLVDVWPGQRSEAGDVEGRERLVEFLDGYAARWNEQARWQCDASRERASGRTEDRRWACLLARREELSDLVVEVEQGRDDAPGVSFDRATLQDPLTCRQPGPAALDLPLPEDDRRGPVLMLRRRLARTRIACGLGRWDECSSRLAVLFDESAKLPWPALQAEIRLLQADAIQAESQQATHAESLLRAAIHDAERGGHDAARARAHTKLASLVGSRSVGPQRAREALFAARAIVESLGQPTPLVQDLRRAEALVAVDSDDFVAARRLLEEALAAEESPVAQADLHLALARALDAGALDHRDAVEAAFSAVERRVELYGSEHLLSFDARIELAKILIHGRSYALARDEIIELDATVERLELRETRRGAEVSSLWGQLYLASGELGASYSAFLDAVGQLWRIDPDGIDSARMLGNLAVVESRLGRFSTAAARQRNVLDMLERSLGKGHPRTAVPMMNLVAHARRVGDYAEALSWQTLVVEIVRSDSPSRCVVVADLAELLYLTSGRDAAAPLAVRAWRCQHEDRRRLLARWLDDWMDDVGIAPPALAQAPPTD
ncbi:MAG: tetratricopeptide repeat protein, partial [Myxococcota bacterium]